MAKRSYPSNDFYKHRDGPKRKARMNEWYENKQGHSEVNKFFKAENLVPNSPVNAQSFTPVASQFSPQGESDGDVVFRRNPYGDAEQIVQSEGPVFTKPTQMGQYFDAPDFDPKLDSPNFFSTPGPASEMSSPRGMNTGMTAFGSGPRRNEKKPESKAS